ACFAIFTKTGPDLRLTTTDMSIRFLAPCLSDAFAKAEVIKVGRTLCPVTVNLYDSHNKQVALAQVTYMFLNHKGAEVPR
ncbi:MAG TPA: PaaI family thioesterase, partial [Thermodesulfobacteriota bacterium]|nr:PaaI family thioesterase [Thermodesulfobacteriota bacterium]